MTQSDPKNPKLIFSLQRSAGGFLGLVFSMLVFWVAQYFGASHSFSQLIALPFFLWSICLITCKLIRVPTFLVALSFILSIVGVVLAHQDRAGAFKDIAIAKLSGDDLEAVTQSFWRKLNEYMRVHSGPRLARESGMLAVGDDIAADLVSHNRHSVIWGSTRWINLSGQRQRVARIGELLKTPSVPSYAEDFRDFELVTFIPEVGLSLNPEAATVEYLTFLLLGGYVDEREGDKVLSQADRELYLWQASGVVGGWINQVHRALPALLLANMKLISSLSSGQFQSAEIECAIKLYNRGLGLINLPEESLELYGALLNNLGVAEYINFELSGAGDLKSAIDRIRKANLLKRARLKKNWYEPVAWRVAYSNLMLLVQRGEYQLNEQSSEDERVPKKRKRSK